MTVLLKRSMFFFPIVLVMGQAAMQPVVVKDLPTHEHESMGSNVLGVEFSFL
jgi:hypothetical protein